MAKDTISIGFEDKIWKAADVLRGNLNASEYEGVVLGLGVKTGDELYFAHIDAGSDDEAVKAGLASVGITENFDLIGASLVTLTGKDGSFDLEHLYYNEREGGDFSAWVKW